MGYVVYNVLLILCSPVIVLILLSKKRCRRGVWQRIGRAPSAVESTGAPVVWVHAVSLGEVVAVSPLVKRLRAQEPRWRIVVSTITETGREAVERHLSGIAEHCYGPLDFPWAVRSYINRIQPSAFILVETELWPNLLRGLSRQHVPTFLVNGRLSSRSFERYRWVRGFMSQVLSVFTLCLMQSERDVERMAELGADPDVLHRTGNMKFDHGPTSDTPSPRPNGADLGLRSQDILLVAGSTHPVEEEHVLCSYQRVSRAVPATVLLLAPRHIERVQHIEDMIRAFAIPCVRKSRLPALMARDALPEGPRVVILDTRGELASLYALAHAAFVGGTFVPVGGHNLLEPARWARPVFFGPFTDHCAEIAELLLDGGGGVRVHNADELHEGWLRACRDESWGDHVGHAAYQVLARNRGVVDRNLELIAHYLDAQLPASESA